MESVNEPASLLKSISQPRPMGYQAAPIPAPLSPFGPTFSHPILFVFPPLSLFRDEKMQWEGWIPGGLSARRWCFFFFLERGQRWMLRNWEPMSWGSARLSKQWGKCWKWLVTAAPCSLSCDILLNMWSLPSSAGALWHLSTAHRRFVRS